MSIIDGKAVSAAVRERVRLETQELKKQGVTPGLAVIIVGDDPASQVYVRNKEKACAEVGFYSEKFALPASTTQQQLNDLVKELNGRKDINGILCQLPLPNHLDDKEVINLIDPIKDVDAFHPVNVGAIMIGDYNFLPCTPAGIMELIRSSGVETKGKKAVVIGRSNIVGKPMALLLMQKGIDATVTVCNTKTPDLREYTKDADIIIVATGHPGTIDSSYVKDGASVIDVGVNRIKDETREKGFRLVGDADYSSFKDRDVMITPVPGGVGLMTVSMLMENTLEAAVKRRGR